MKQCSTDHSVKKTKMGVQSLWKIRGLGRYAQTLSWDLQAEILWEQTEITRHKYIKVIHPSSNCLPEGGKILSGKKKIKSIIFNLQCLALSQKLCMPGRQKWLKTKRKRKQKHIPGVGVINKNFKITLITQSRK